MKKIAHVFYDCHLGLGHTGALEILHEKTKKHLKEGEVALFLNSKMTAAKILCGPYLLLYYRGPQEVTTAMLKNIPTLFGGKSFAFSGSFEAKIMKLAAEVAPKKTQSVKILAA